MKPATLPTWIARGIVLLVTLSPGLLIAPSSVRAQSQTVEDERTLHSAGLSIDGPSLPAFFQARARTEVDREHLRQLLRRFTMGTREERGPATAELLGLGPLALPGLRKAANDLR